MDQKAFRELWIEYLKESNFKKKYGKADYDVYVKRIKSGFPLSTRPTVRPFSDIIGIIFNAAESNATIAGEMTVKDFKKWLLYEFFQWEQNSLLLHVDALNIKSPECRKAAVAKIGKLITAKRKSIWDDSKRWTDPGRRIDPELSLYLTLYRESKKPGVKISELDKIAQAEALKIKANREACGKSDKKIEEKFYNSESAIRRAIGYAERIMRNVERGIFPGEYK